jgi:hypothetical protein
VRNIPQIYSCYAATMSPIIHFEPFYYKEKNIYPIWRDVIMEEYQSTMKDDVWDIVLRPEGKSIVTSKSIYKIKHRVDKSIKRHKMRFVSRGFSQVKGIDYHETFAHVSRYTSIWMFWRVHHMDVNTTFINGDIEEEVYIKKPDGFVIHKKESHVCRLKKALDGLKKEPRAWCARIDGHLMSLGFNKSVVNLDLYYKIVNGDSLILVLYIDDLFLTGTESLIVE